MEQMSCIICYRFTPDIVELSKPHHERNKRTLSRFFHLLARHLDDPKLDIRGGDGLGAVVDFPFEKVIQAGMLTCPDCSGILESFCELYHKMKSTELMLNWKVRQLKDIMQCAQRFPTRVRDFRGSAAKLDMGDVTADETLEFKTELVKRCAGKLQTSLPKLTMHKYNPNQIETKTVVRKTTSTTPNLNMNDSESWQGSHIVLSDCDDEEPIKDIIRPSDQRDLISSHSFAEEIPSDGDDGMVGSNDKDLGTHGHCLDSNNLSPLVQEVTGNPEKISPGIKGPTTESTVRESSETAIPPPIIIPSECSDERPQKEKQSKLSFQCPRCLQIFHFRQSYVFHFQRAHIVDVDNVNSKKGFQCQFCLKTFSLLYNKQRHMQRNCPKSSGNRSKRSAPAPSSLSATSTMNSTSGVGAVGVNESTRHVYQCTACSKAFTQNYHLRRHFKAVHLQLREHHCSLCSSKFKQKEHLDKHRGRVHAKRKLQKQSHGLNLDLD